ncbi:MAG: ApbE family protein [bacterium ADurb.Bin270]|nr:MAG: ApbE family protein [bacterium ADurb.Bin270]
MKNSKALAALAVLAITLVFPFSQADAESRQISAQGVLLDGTPISMTIIADESMRESAESAVSDAISRISSVDLQLFSADGIQDKINSLGKSQKLELPFEIFDMISKSVELSALTKGWFDIAAPSKKEMFINRDWRRIVLDDSSRSMSFKSDGMQLDLSKISKGYYADMAIGEASKAGFSDAMVEIGSVQRNIGHDIFTPWKVDIGFGGTTSDNLAHRAISYKIRNIASTTVSENGLGSGLIDGRSKLPVAQGQMRSVTILSQSAVRATAYALAAYAIGPKYAMHFVNRHPDAKGILVDNSGKIASSEGLNTDSINLVNRWQTENPNDGGPNDLKKKEQEENSDL